MRVIKKPNSYPPSLRENAVALVRRSERPIDQIAESLGLPPSTLRYWYDVDVRKKTKKTKRSPASPKLPVGDPAGESSEEKIARLEKRNALLEKQVASLTEDREILKKAAAFFAKESE